MVFPPLCNRRVVDPSVMLNLSHCAQLLSSLQVLSNFYATFGTSPLGGRCLFISCMMGHRSHREGLQHFPPENLRSGLKQKPYASLSCLALPRSAFKSLRSRHRCLPEPVALQRGLGGCLMVASDNITQVGAEKCWQTSQDSGESHNQVAPLNHGDRAPRAGWMPRFTTLPFRAGQSIGGAQYTQCR